MNCPSCDGAISDGAAFCEHCGEAIEWVEEPAAAAADDTRIAELEQQVAALLEERERSRPAGPPRAEGPASDEPSPAEQPAPPRRLPAPAALAGAIFVAGSAFLPWLISGEMHSTGLDTPAAILWDFLAAPGGLSIGVLMLGLGLFGILLTLVPRAHVARRIVGGIVTAAVVMLFVQITSYLSDVGLQGETLGLVSAGVYLALSGGLMLALSPAALVRR